MITQDCPECDLIAQHDDNLEAILANAKSKNYSKEETEELAQPERLWLKDHNCDRKWHFNVMQENGEFAVLTLSHKTKKNKLEPLITRLLSEEGIDALEPEQGVWFRITRTGKQIEAVDHIEAVEEAVKDPTTGRISKTTKLAPLTEADEQKALKECPDLATSVTVITYAQIKALTECSGEPEAVDEIFALSQKREGSPAGKAKQQQSATPAPTTGAKPDVKPQSKVEEAKPAAPAQAAGPSQADLMAMIAQLQAQLAGGAAQASAPAPVSAPATEAPVSAPVAERSPRCRRRCRRARRPLLLRWIARPSWRASAASRSSSSCRRGPCLRYWSRGPVVMS
jgi:hypothetical protein